MTWPFGLRVVNNSKTFLAKNAFVSLFSVYFYKAIVTYIMPHFKLGSAVFLFCTEECFLLNSSYSLVRSSPSSWGGQGCSATKVNS